MRKITAETYRAFEQGESLSRGNTYTDGQGLYLHENKIAERKAGWLYITLAGWNTNTTRERLNGLTGVQITTKQGQAYLNGKEWDGKWVQVQKWKL